MGWPRCLAIGHLGDDEFQPIEETQSRISPRIFFRSWQVALPVTEIVPRSSQFYRDERDFGGSLEPALSEAEVSLAFGELGDDQRRKQLFTIPSIFGDPAAKRV
jgi:hypothetical protein